MSTTPAKVTLLAYARVRLVVEVEVGSWASDASMDQIFMQAASGAMDQLQSLQRSQQPFEIIGEPVVEAVLMRKEAR